ncbi:hypothetical protein GCM10023339_76400 [Alloalcanivorax gelatiniphagus]
MKRALADTARTHSPGPRPRACVSADCSYIRSRASQRACEANLGGTESRRTDKQYPSGPLGPKHRTTRLASQPVTAHRV